MKKTELRSLIREEIKKVLAEVQLDPVNQKLKNQYIMDYLSYTVDPYEYEGTDINKIEAHADKHGYADTLRTIDQKETKVKQMFGGEDPLASKAPGTSVGNLTMRDPLKNLTKGGKMNKGDVDRLKMKIRQNLGIDLS